MYDSGNCPCFHWIRYIVRACNILYNILESVQCLPHLEGVKVFILWVQRIYKDSTGKTKPRNWIPNITLRRLEKYFVPNHNFQDSLSPSVENYPCFFSQLFWIRSINHQYSLGWNPVAWITFRTRIRYFCLSYNQISRLAAPCYIVADWLNMLIPLYYKAYLSDYRMLPVSNEW